MPIERTRAIYIERQKKLLGRGSSAKAVKLYNAEWNQKGVNGKHNWVAEHRRLKDQLAVAEAAQLQWRQAYEEYQRVLNSPRDASYGYRFGRPHRKAIGATQSAQQAFNDLHICYMDFWNLESRQPTPSAESLTHSLIHAGYCRNRIQYYANQLAELHRLDRGPLFH